MEHYSCVFSYDVVHARAKKKPLGVSLPISKDPRCP